jgi:hypothetical protein
VSSSAHNKAAVAAVTQYLRAGKPIALAVTSVARQIPRGSNAKPPRLRFDRVVLRVLADLRSALANAVPQGTTAVLTLTAPIRLASKTTASIEELIRALLTQKSAPEPFTDSVHGNGIQIRIMRVSKSSAARVAGFVHNRDSDPGPLFDIAHELLHCMPKLERSRRSVIGEPRLVLALEDEPRWTETYRRVCEQVVAPADLKRLLLVATDGKVSPAVD